MDLLKKEKPARARHTESAQQRTAEGECEEKGGSYCCYQATAAKKRKKKKQQGAPDTFSCS
jgi:hypothetical protein